MRSYSRKRLIYVRNRITKAVNLQLATMEDGPVFAAIDELRIRAIDWVSQATHVNPTKVLLQFTFDRSHEPSSERLCRNDGLVSCDGVACDIPCQEWGDTHTCDVYSTKRDKHLLGSWHLHHDTPFDDITKAFFQAAHLIDGSQEQLDYDLALTILLTFDNVRVLHFKCHGNAHLGSEIRPDYFLKCSEML